MNKTLLVTVIASSLFLGAIGLNQVFAASYDCQVTVNGKGCIIAQKAKDDIRNTINIMVSGTGGGTPPSGNGTDYSGDINKLKGDIAALQTSQATQQNELIDLKNKDTQQDQTVNNVTNQVVTLQVQNAQLREDVNKLLDFMNNGTQIVVLPDNSTSTGGNTTTTEPPGGDNSTTIELPDNITDTGNNDQPHPEQLPS
jgi:uncharacterized coiled-coil protein SlyX